MRIKTVQIQNFRTLEDVTIEFDSITTFIGPNGAGKSTVLRALDWFFNGKQGDLVDEDCSFGNIDKQISVSVTFENLTDKDREALEKYAPEGSSTFTAWKIRNFDGSETMSANARSFSPFNSIKVAANVPERKRLYGELRENQPELMLPSATTGKQIEDAMIRWEAENPDQLTASPSELQTNFFGFNSKGKMSGLFDFVLVTADLRASEESVDGKSSIIGRILERSVDRTAADEEVAKIVERSRIQQQQVYGEKFKEQLADLESRINGAVHSFSPGRTISVAPKEIELKAPRTTFNVSVVDGETSTSVERQGHGFQRTLLIAALRVLAESGEASEDGVICLAVEEPELYQHPIQAQAFAKVLRSLAEDENRNIQVTYATHSPYFLEARYFHQVRRLVREGSPNPSVAIHSASVADIKDRLSGVVKPATVDRQLDALTTGALSSAIFANRVLLVEGTTESAVLYGIGDKESVGALEAAGLEIAPIGGKGNVPLAHAILKSLGIPTFCLFDGDKGYEARALQTGKDAKKIAEEKSGHVSANRRLLKYFELEVEDFPQKQLTPAVAIFEDHLEEFLSIEWPDWITACQSLEREAGIILTKNQDAYRKATLDSEGETPQFLLDVLARALEADETPGSA